MARATPRAGLPTTGSIIQLRTCLTTSPARNKADSLVYQTEKMLSEHRSMVADADAKAVEAAIADTKKALEGSDVDAIEELARAPEVDQRRAALENARREHLIVRVDRMDLSKNILRGFLA